MWIKTHLDWISCLEVTVIVLLLWLVACASPMPKEVEVKTWVVGIIGLERARERMPFVDAAGYRCYSRDDDEKWRELLAGYASGCQK